MSPSNVDSSETPTLSTSSQASNITNSDPLLEQMNNVLGLNALRLASQPKRRERRFSDADRAPFDAPAISRENPWAVCNKESPKQPAIPDAALEQHVCRTTDCALAKVLSTPELLELTLSFLDTQSVLTLRATNKQWSDTVLHSPTLRLHLFVHGNWDRHPSDFELAPLHLPGLALELGEELHLGRWVVITMTPDAARRIAPENGYGKRVRSRSIYEGLRGGLGSRRPGGNDAWPAATEEPASRSGPPAFKDLLITQPPLTSMQAFLIYPDTTGSGTTLGGTHGEDQPAVDEPKAAELRAKISCPDGITVGFLAETFESLPSPRLPLDSTSGFSDAELSAARCTGVVFKGIMSFTAPSKPKGKRGKGGFVTMI